MQCDESEGAAGEKNAMKQKTKKLESCPVRITK